MLMRVIGYCKKNGEYKTKYALQMDGVAWRKEVFLNHGCYLHDPKRFNL
jgi:hypothetical protein